MCKRESMQEVEPRTHNLTMPWTEGICVQGDPLPGATLWGQRSGEEPTVRALCCGRFWVAVRAAPGCVWGFLRRQVLMRPMWGACDTEGAPPAPGVKELRLYQALLCHSGCIAKCYGDPNS